MLRALEPDIKLIFTNSSDEVCKIAAIGYNNFEFVKGSEVYRALPWDSLHFVVRGHGTLFLRGKSYSIRPGDFFVAPMNESVMYYPDREDPWCYFWIDFDGNSSFSVIDKIGLSREHPVKCANDPEKLSLLFRKLFTSGLKQTALYYAALSVVMQIISENHIESAFPRKDTRAESLIDKVKLVIEHNYKNPDFSVGNIADMLYLNNSHVSRLFHEKTGITMVAYLTKRRLNAAIKLLEKKPYTVNELCTLIGWNNRQHFMKCFKREFHKTVKEYSYELNSRPKSRERK